MRYVLRFAFVVVVVTLAWNWSASLQRPQAARRQTERLITMRVQASNPSPPISVTVSEGYAVQVQWTERRVHNRFALRPNVVDGDGRSVRVAIESPFDGRVLGEVVLTEGGPPRQADISPQFAVEVVQVEER